MSRPHSLSASGLIAAPFTPLQADGTLNLAAIGPYATRLVRDGVSGAFVCGTTGEGSSLTTAERQQVAARWQADKPAALRLFVHVGHNALGDAQELARHAQKIGAGAIAALAPHFFRPGSLDDLINWCGAVAGAAPAVPFYYYHMPGMTGVNFAMADFLPRAAERIPTFAGIKFTHENLMDYGLTIAASGGRHEILFGRDEILLSALPLGAPGAVGSTYNYAAPIFNSLLRAWQAGDAAGALRTQTLVQKFIDVFVRHGGMSANKAIMGLTGFECGPLRSPLRTLETAAIAKLRADLDAVGFFAALAESSRAA